MSTKDLQQLLGAVTQLAKVAGGATMPFFNAEKPLDIQRKEDETPVTAADLAANALIVAGLRRLDATIPVITEEEGVVAYSVRSNWPYCWLVDPLDGTKGFIDHSDDFSVNIALVYKHRPVLGVIYLPAQNLCYFAANELGVFKQQGDKPAQVISGRSFVMSEMRVALGQYHVMKNDPFLVGCSKNTLVRANGSVKFCYLAEGVAHCYPRLGPTSEWDTAAGQCILEQAGGIVVDLNGNSLQYNARESVRNPEFIALSDPTRLHDVLELITTRR